MAQAMVRVRRNSEEQEKTKGIAAALSDKGAPT
jgi:hypothetical protein